MMVMVIMVMTYDDDDYDDGGSGSAGGGGDDNNDRTDEKTIVKGIGDPCKNLNENSAYTDDEIAGEISVTAEMM